MLDMINLGGEDAAPDSVTRKIVQNAMRSPVELTSAPTTAGNELPSHGDWGVFGTNLYMNLSGSTYKFTGTLV